MRTWHAAGLLSISFVTIGLQNHPTFASGVDATFVNLYVNMHYVQTGDTTPVLASDNPVEYGVEVIETSSAPNSVTSASVTGNFSLSAPLVYEGGDVWAYREFFPSTAALETARDGSASVSVVGVHDGTLVQKTIIPVLSLNSVSAPHITDATSLTLLDPTSTFSVTIDPLSGSSNGFSEMPLGELTILDQHGDVVYDVNAGPADDVVVPANVLAPNQAYVGEFKASLAFLGGGRGDVYGNGSEWDATTNFTMQTVPEPATLIIFGLSLVGPFYATRRRS